MCWSGKHALTHHVKCTLAHTGYDQGSWFEDRECKKGYHEASSRPGQEWWHASDSLWYRVQSTSRRVRPGTTKSYRRHKLVSVCINEQETSVVILTSNVNAKHIVCIHSRKRVYTRASGTWWVSLNICRNIKQSVAVIINVSVDTIPQKRARHTIGEHRTGEVTDPEPSAYHSARRV